MFRITLFFVIAVLYIFWVRSSIDDKGGYQQDLQFIFPPELWLVLCFGDKNLAGNLDYFRVVTTPYYQDANVQPRAALHQNVASNYPLHYGNLYQAVSSLPWNGYVNEAVFVGEKVSKARSWDEWPPYFYGTMLSRFKEDHVKASKIVLEAANRAAKVDSTNEPYYRNMAANIAVRGVDVNESLAFLSILIDSTSDEGLKRHLSVRKQRLEILKRLRTLALQFEVEHDRKLKLLDELYYVGMLTEEVIDPTGGGYVLDSKGVPQLAKRLPKDA